MFTSNFRNHGNYFDAVSIAKSSPGWFKANNGCRFYPDLAPTWELITHWKYGNLSEYMYKVRYLNLIESRGLSPSKVLADLGEYAILLCWEESNQFCHRHIVAEWLNDNMINCSEL